MPKGLYLYTAIESDLNTHLFFRSKGGGGEGGADAQQKKENEFAAEFLPDRSFPLCPLTPGGKGHAGRGIVDTVKKNKIK